MTNPYLIRTLKMTSGERFPVLIDTRTGNPVFAPTVYSLTQLRGRNLATQTIAHGLREVMLLLLFLEDRGIDVEKRFQEGRILDLGEIESLARVCSVYLEDVVEELDQRVVRPSRITSIERLRTGGRYATTRNVTSVSAGNRLRGIADYLSWLAKAQLLRLSTSSREYQAFEAARQTVVDALIARAPDGGDRNVLGAREGLPPEAMTRLLAVTSATSSENPWSGEFTKTRNELIFRWLHSLGVRRGELLNVKISDINFREETVTIVRRADAPEDPRHEQPLVKTKDRLLPLAPELCRLTQDYIIKQRRSLAGARRHEYLFVADKTGAPMSLSALNKCFAFLRTCIPDLPNSLSPHVLRHTWNDRFSKAMDRKKTPEADEKKMRSFLMGWSEGSDTASTYTRRHVREKALEASMLLQSDMIKNQDI